MNETKQRLVASFDKNSAEKVRIYMQEWKGQTYIDIRVWASEEAGQEGAEFATRKGITLRVELLGDLRRAIDAALAEVELDEAEESGLGPEEADGKIPF